MKGIIILLSFFTGELFLTALGFETSSYQSFKLKSDKKDYLFLDSINEFRVKKGFFNVDLEGFKYKISYN
jgi:hypothetical protein